MPAAFARPVKSVHGMNNRDAEISGDVGGGVRKPKLALHVNRIDIFGQEEFPQELPRACRVRNDRQFEPR